MPHKLPINSSNSSWLLIEIMMCALVCWMPSPPHHTLLPPTPSYTLTRTLSHGAFNRTCPTLHLLPKRFPLPTISSPKVPWSFLLPNLSSLTMMVESACNGGGELLLDTLCQAGTTDNTTNKQGTTNLIISFCRRQRQWIRGSCWYALNRQTGGARRDFEGASRHQFQSPFDSPWRGKQ